MMIKCAWEELGKNGGNKPFKDENKQILPLFAHETFLQEVRCLKPQQIPQNSVELLYQQS